jgi:hypothetical protein
LYGESRAVAQTKGRKNACTFGEQFNFLHIGGRRYGNFRIVGAN